ncbi:MAG: caspase family protein [Spirochaetota bacterium]
MNRKALLALLAILSLTQLLPAQTAPVRRVALVIGNGAYLANALKNPPNDAEDVAAALKESGFEVSLVKDASLEAMDKAVNDFAAWLKGADTGLFYYAGHGVAIDGMNWLIPVSPRIDDAASPKTQNSLIAYATSPGDVAQDGSGRNGVFSGAVIRQLRESGLERAQMMKNVKAEVAARLAAEKATAQEASLEAEPRCGQFGLGQAAEIIESAKKKLIVLDDSVKRKLDWLYVIRTNVDKSQLADSEAVRTYKRLAKVERAFRCMKQSDLEIRPVYHWRSDRSRAGLEREGAQGCQEADRRQPAGPQLPVPAQRPGHADTQHSYDGQGRDIHEVLGNG